MKRKGLFIVACLALVFLAVSCSKGREHKIIPQKDFARIYAEMFIVDQWLNDNRQYSHTSDTTLVYEPIFNKYGYTTDDYIASVDYYLYDPASFSKIVLKAVDILEKQQAALKGHKETVDKEVLQDEGDR